MSAGRSARPLDDVDRRIVSELVADGRVSVTELAERVGVSRANAYARFERLQRDGVVRGFGARIDHRALGLSVTALITITADQHAWRPLRDDIVAMPEVDYFALTTGEFDLVVLVVRPTSRHCATSCWCGCRTIRRSGRPARSSSSTRSSPTTHRLVEPLGVRAGKPEASTSRAERPAPALRFLLRNLME